MPDEGPQMRAASRPPPSPEVHQEPRTHREYRAGYLAGSLPFGVHLPLKPKAAGIAQRTLQGFAALDIGQSRPRLLLSPLAQVHQREREATGREWPHFAEPSAVSGWPEAENRVIDRPRHRLARPASQQLRTAGGEADQLPECDRGCIPPQ